MLYEEETHGITACGRRSMNIVNTASDETQNSLGGELADNSKVED